MRSLVFGPHEKYVHRLGYAVAAFQLRDSLSDLAQVDGAILLEPNRSMWVFPFDDAPPTVMMTYRTEDVDAEFTEPPAQRLRAAFGSRPAGRALGERSRHWSPPRTSCSTRRNRCAWTAGTRAGSCSSVTPRGV